MPFGYILCTVSSSSIALILLYLFELEKLSIFDFRKLLSSLTVLYFQSDESIGERSMVIVACLVYILIAMIVLIIDESILETGLEEAYRSFNNSATEFLNQQGLRSS